VPLDLQAKEDGQAEPGPQPADLRAVPGDDAAGLLLITAYGLRIVAASGLVAVPTALFLTVYLGAMAAAARLLPGPARLAALPGGLAVTVMLGFCGWALAIPAAVALAACWRPRAAASRERSTARPAPAVRCPATARERRLMAAR